jgi:pimeloyl-ACP methyl ester carboxylesterase
MEAPGTVVLVHGAWHGSWCWDQVAERLDAAGIPNLALDNPSADRADATLADDVANVVAALDAIDGPVVLVGHSYGGAVITEAGAHDAVRHFVYITAFALEVDESLMENALEGGAAGPLDDAMQLDGDVITLETEGAIAALYHDCPDDVARDAASKLRAQSVVSFGGVVRAAAWREKPTTYVVCTEDRGVSPVLQRSAAARVKDVVEIDTSHSPFLSRPDVIADLLRKLAQ